MDILREHTVLLSVETKLKCRLIEMRQHQQAAAVAFTPVNDPSGESGVASFKNASNEYNTLGQRLLPYLKWVTEEADTLNVNDPSNLKQLWEEAFKVKMDDPAIKAQLKAMAEPQLKKKTSSLTGTEDARRLFKLRNRTKRRGV